jgi:preprotein translocase subunit SecE
MAKDAKDRKAPKRRTPAGTKQTRDETEEALEPRVFSLTKEGASKPVAMVRAAYEASGQFLREVRTELKKVTWPSRKETLASTGVVLVIVFIVAAYLGLVDLLLSHVIGAILH